MVVNKRHYKKSKTFIFDNKRALNPGFIFLN